MYSELHHVQADGVGVAFGFQELVNLGLGEGGVVFDGASNFGADPLFAI
jgi:hypothetical protein